MRDLPAEIYTIIFLYLEKEDLQECYFVCKSWHTMAIPLGWEEVTLRTHNISLVKSHFNNLNHSPYFKYSHLIKKLVFEDSIFDEHADKFSRLELLELLNLLPNLNEIDFSGTDHSEKYVEFLLDADMQHIKNIYTRFNFCDIQSDLLFSVNYKFRNSITRIELLYDRNTINVIDSLSLFKKLTKLEIYDKCDLNLTPFKVQDNCPNLEDLRFFSDHLASESVMQHILDNNRGINLNFFLSLTSLDLCQPSLTTTYTKCLVDYFTNKLNRLDITIADQGMFNWIDIVGMKLALRLMEKAGGVDKTHVQFLLREEYEVRANDENNMTKYFKLLNSFRGARQTQCTAHFSDTIVDRRYLGYSFKYDSLGRLFVTYNLHISDLHESNTGDMTVPNKTSSIIGPEIFHILEIDLLRLHHDDDDVHRVLNYSLSNFPALQTLNITWNLHGFFLSSLSFGHKESKISSNQANRDINFLQMENIRPSKYLVDLLTTHLHNIEIVSLKAKYWGCDYNSPIIDLTGFKKLKSFKYTCTSDKKFTGENKFALIKYTNGTERRFYEYPNPKKRI